MKNFFTTQIGHQTLAGLITVSAFPFLYLGGIGSNSSLLVVGLSLVLIGMLAAPVITYVHLRNLLNKDTYKGGEKFETSSNSSRG